MYQSRHAKDICEAIVLLKLVRWILGESLARIKRLWSYSGEIVAVAVWPDIQAKAGLQSL
jgi:hypothetical protein